MKIGKLELVIQCIQLKREDITLKNGIFLQGGVSLKAPHFEVKEVTDNTKILPTDICQQSVQLFWIGKRHVLSQKAPKSA